MRTLITGGLVVDSTGRRPVLGGVVAIEGGRVTAVGRAEDFPAAQDGAEIIDASGCTVLPGLVDTHVHVLSYAGRQRYTEAEAGIWAANYLQASLRGGVTTIRDLASRYEAIFALKRSLSRGWLVGPRLLVVGAGICTTGGHGHDALCVEADGADAVRRAARIQIQAGADAIKLMATGGVGTPGRFPTACQLGVEEMRAAVEEAHKVGLPAVAHAMDNTGVRNAILAGVDCVEHGTFLDRETIELMLGRGVALCPTVSALRRIVQGGKLGITRADVARNAIPLVEPHFESFRMALAAGVKLVWGTECGMPHHPLGDAVLELELWVQAGMEPLAVLEAATRLSATACQIEQEVGTLEPGKRADVLIVEGDASSDITAMNNVRRVLMGGSTVYDATDGDARIGRVGRPLLGPRPKPPGG